MKHNLTMDFSVNKETKTITVKREFNADLPLVWQAFTDKEILDQWWAPEPWKAKTKSMDFRVGGQWLYAMVSPTGEEHWSYANFQIIQQQKSYTAFDGFCDKDGNINSSMPQSKWETIFTNENQISTVVFVITYDDLNQLEKIIEMGFQGGFTMGLNQLEKLLKTL
jgi:uncharacterized protein YndB with AHSA1/START domain